MGDGSEQMFEAALRRLALARFQVAQAVRAFGCADRDLERRLDSALRYVRHLEGLSAS